MNQIRKRPTAVNKKLAKRVRKRTKEHPAAKEVSIYSVGIAIGLGGVALSLYKLDPTKTQILKNIPLDRDQWHAILPIVLTVFLFLTAALVVISYKSWKDDVAEEAAAWAQEANDNLPQIYPAEDRPTAPKISVRHCMPQILWLGAWCILPLLLLGAALVCTTRYWQI